MSDFLTRIAERALGTAPRIDPEPATRYAPSRLPLPGPVLRAEATEGVSSRAPNVAPRDAYDKKPKQEPLSLVPAAKPLMNKAAMAGEAGPQPALGADSSPEESAVSAQGLESPTISIEPGTPPPGVPGERVSKSAPAVESQSKSIAQIDRDPEDRDQAGDQARPAIDTLPQSVILEAAIIRDERGETPSGSAAFPTQAPDRQASQVYFSALEETALQREKNELQPAAQSSAPGLDDGAGEAKLGPQIESIRPAAPNLPATATQRQSAATVDDREARRPISTDFVTAAKTRVDHFDYGHEEKSEPTIRVTIGRVEVRNVAPPPAAVEPVTSPAPKLSLAEFLRQHRERRR